MQYRDCGDPEVDGQVTDACDGVCDPE